MRLIIVRHGETVENVNKINQGIFHGRLSDKGICQAQKLALRLKNEKIDVIYSSDLNRAKDTAKEILRFFKSVPVSYVSELRERAYGIFEGTPHGAIRKHVQENNLDFVSFKPQNGESINEMKQRAVNFYNKVLEKHRDQTVLWVTHGGIIVNLLLHLKNLPDERYKEVAPPNGAMTIIEIKEKNMPRIQVENCTEHCV